MRDKNKKLLRMGLIGLFLLVVSSGGFLASAAENENDEVIQLFDPLDKEFYLSQSVLLFIRPGLDFEVTEVTIGEDRRPVATFTLKDPRGLPLDRDGIFTPGPVSTTWIIARLPLGEIQYINYDTREVTSSITGNTAFQPDRDRTGTYAKVEDGVYTYTFGNPLPEDYQREATHTIGAYARRDLREFNLDRYVDNEVVSWVPSGAPVTHVRDVVVTEACNQCHNPLALHGGSRRETGLCILCHNPQAWDPDTGNTLDLKVMIHRIHIGDDLPSVAAGIPYQIIGYGGSVHDWADLEFPQDIRNCETCHVPGPDVLTEAEVASKVAAGEIVGGAQSSNWNTKPTRDTCDSCHNDISFATGAGHPGGAQTSDDLCSLCHQPQGAMEFDASIRGAHTVEYKSTQLKGLNVEILDVTNNAPGQSPTVHFKLTENDGTVLTLDVLDRISFNLAGPTTDYATLVRESSVDDAVIAVGDGSYTYTFVGTLPADATGSYAVGSEARRDVLLSGSIDFREQVLENPVFYFSVDGSPVVPRRTVVADEKCETCHDNLSLHGSNRHDPEYCVTCHQPGASDLAVRPDEELPVESIHFKYLIHRVHSGEELTEEFTVYGYNNSVHDFTEILFPGDLRDCETCHVNDSYELPLPENLLSTPTPRGFFSPLQPIAGACLGCHDSESTAAHAFTMSSPFGEACVACHGSGADFSVERVHAR